MLSGLCSRDLRETVLVMSMQWKQTPAFFLYLRQQMVMNTALGKCTLLHAFVSRQSAKVPLNCQIKTVICQSVVIPFETSVAVSACHKMNFIATSDVFASVYYHRVSSVMGTEVSHPPSVNECVLYLVYATSAQMGEKLT